MTRRLVFPAAALVFFAAATAGAAISILVRTPAEVAAAAATGNLMMLCHALAGVIIGAVLGVLHYL